MSEITIREETGHGMFTELYRSAGLDIGEDWINTCHPVWSAAARRGGVLLGAATVSCRSGRLVLEYLAVVPEARAHGLGRKLTALCLEYAAEAGAEDLWIAAREPGFYRKLGAAESEDTALLEDCRRCPDYLRNCRPKELVFHLKENA